MAGCVPCFIIPLLLFIFHRYIQPILLKFWNPWEKKVEGVDGQVAEDTKAKQDLNMQCLSNWSCPCAVRKDPTATSQNETAEPVECKKTN